jgi:hypothetical protein
MTTLEEKGYAIVPGMLTEKECQDNIDRLWVWMEGLGRGIKRNDPKTWKSKNWPTSIHGIIQHYRVGHTDFVWNVRSHPNVYKEFAKIWGTKKLLTSFDGACVMKPPEKTGFWPREKQWFHTDQSYRDSSLKCIQGLVPLETMSDQDGTLEVLAGSHKHHNAFVKWKKEQADNKWVPSASNWHKLTNDEFQWYLEQEGVKRTKVSAPKGSLVLWDSRTIHKNAYPVKGRPNARWRYVVYSCMLPADNIRPRDMAKKQQALANMRMTTHWPYPVYLFSKEPRSYGQPTMDYKTVDNLDHLSPLARKLAGLDEWTDFDEIVDEHVEDYSDSDPETSV